MSDSGAIIVWFSIVLGALMALAALAIDFQIDSASQNEQNFTAEYLSLAALETYSSTAGSYNDRVDAARQRLTSIAGRNFLLASPTSRLMDAPSDMAIGEDATGDAGSLIPGAWFFYDPGCSTGTAPSSVDKCPCDGLTFTEPCFRPNQPGDLSANAFKVNLHTKFDIPHLFARTMGNDSTRFDVSATATLIPKEVLFLVDLSRSTTYDTHPPAPGGSTAKAIDYNWRFNEDQLPALSNFCDSTSGHDNPCPNGHPDAQSSYPLIVNNSSYSCPATSGSHSVGSCISCTNTDDADCSAPSPGSGSIELDSLNGQCSCVTSYNQNSVSYPCQACLVENCWEECDPDNPDDCSTICDPPHWEYTYCTSCWWSMSNITCPFETNPEAIDYEVFQTYRYNKSDYWGASPTSVNSTTHNRRDYECFTSQGVDLDSDNVDDRYLFDRGSAGTYAGPQPLTSIFSGISDALEIVEARMVYGDQIGVIGFDETMTGLEMRCLGFTNPEQSDYGTLKEIFNTDNTTAAQFQERIDHMFFPRFEANTDIALGMTWAGHLFKERDCANIPALVSSGTTPLSGPPDPRPISRSVVLFTDGISNCVSSACDPTSWDIHRSALFDHVAPLAGQFGDHRISVNVMMFGNGVAPHTLLRKDSSGCMSDATARENGTRYIDGEDIVIAETKFGQLDSIWGTSPDIGLSPYLVENAYFYPLEFFYNNVAGRTKGLFGSIRPACSPTDIGASNQTDCQDNGNSYLDDICNSTPGAAETLVIASPLTDDAARLACDPTCAPMKDQVGDFVEQIYSVSPYILVE